TENWTKDEFFEWSKSYFENGKAWSFIAKERNIYLSDKNTIVWFDEQLEYPGGVLRGSGVLAKEKNGWKLKHYVLSLPVPNNKFKEVLGVIKPKTPEKEKEE
ncbi:MAG: nuclear transport factor 2 family protein, partial [Bacteroidales bacterium]|nr:nuclear transport factor 2 family protein [Bacteroidales bacterium]